MVLLEIEDLHIYYGNVHALKGVGITVGEGEIVTLLGANGAGKSTILRTISGLVRPRSGKVVFRGTGLNEMPAHDIVRGGISQAPEGRKIFATLTVDENLTLGAYVRLKDRPAVEDSRNRVFELFPRLEERRDSRDDHGGGSHRGKPSGPA